MAHTSAALAALYDWLRLASPTLSALPPSNMVRFKWVRRFGMFGECRVHEKNIKSGKGPIATIVLTARNNTPQMLVETMAHEAVHLYQYSEEVAARGFLRSNHHGPKFRRLAERVCQELHLNFWTF